MILIMDNLRSAHNVGSLFRSADGAGVKHIYIVGITPVPVKTDQGAFTIAQKTIQKTALGAEFTVPWSRVKSLARLLARLKREGYETIALEEGSTRVSHDYRDWQPKRGFKPALIVGNEVVGIDSKTLARADTLIHLPMRGKKHSLNVSVAGGIAMYHLSATMDE